MITLTAIVLAFALGSLVVKAWNTAAAKSLAKAPAERPLQRN